MDLYQEVIFKSRYARWLDDEKRRESWEESIDRYIDYFKNRVNCSDIEWDVLRKKIKTMDIMPSMRSLLTAGKALDRDEIANYNCSYLTVNSLRAFDEAMYILMCGCGVGFSVENEYVKELPEISEEFNDTDTTIIVKDSRIGWAVAFRELLSLLWSGQVPQWDLSKLRPQGARLKTFGGRSSGPKPLDDLFKFSVQLVKNAKGRKLTSIECHDLMCKISEVVVVGGVRRSACLSMSDLYDDTMRMAKHGKWYIENPQRQLANNSAVYTETPNVGVFMQEWFALYESKSGERGIINRKALKNKAKETSRRNPDYDFGLNPCAEAILRPFGLCNLTEVIIRENDTVESVKEKIKYATILGTIQASIVNFRYLRAVWRKNAEEEALLGVSLTGIMDNAIFAGKTKDNLPSILNDLKQYSIQVNSEYAKLVGVNPAAQITLVKPSGTISQLVNSASGIHPRFSKYYLRRIRIDKKDPVNNFLIESGIPYEQDNYNAAANVFIFPIESPKNSVCISDMDALKQLNHWLVYAVNWCEGNPSCTIYIKDSEWFDVGAWVYRNFNSIGGLSFLPVSNTSFIYTQLPYTEITEEEYDKWRLKMPEQLNWNIMKEESDSTVSSHEMACAGGMCEL